MLCGKVRDEQTGESALGPARLWLRAVTFGSLPLRTNVLLNFISEVLSLKYTSPILFCLRSKIFKQYFYLSKFFS